MVIALTFRNLANESTWDGYRIFKTSSNNIHEVSMSKHFCLSSEKIEQTREILEKRNNRDEK